MSKRLTLQQVCADYGGQPVVRGVSFEVEAGQLCALLGTNGSGKTTLLKAICGLLPSRGGQCLVDGQPIMRLHEKQRARLLSYIPQRHSRLMGVTVLDTVLMGQNPHVRLFHATTQADRAAAMNCLKDMEISHLAYRDFAALSEGQKQMAIIARALLQDAPVMLMDEPDSALDFVNRCFVLSTIRSTLHRHQKAGLIAMHDPNFALSYCDRLILLKEGQVVAEVSCREAPQEEIRRSLSMIYGKIDLLAHKGQYVMLREEPC